ncbi:Delta2-dienoyl-CoA-isomerase [Hymenopellis radicata]|nr:Delta2-dienoyl-CoA-isomerase [Hymenopellis radicata]
MAPAESFSTDLIKVSEPSPHVYHVELARKPVNAFSAELGIQYGTLFDRLAEEGDGVRAVVLSSALPKIFSAGLDFSDAKTVSSISASPKTDGARNAMAIAAFLKDVQYAFQAPARCPFPVIVAVHGPVIGLGIDLICSCDIRYAASSAVFTIKEVDVGVAADVGTLAYLPKITGNLSVVRELAYTSRSFTAPDAHKLGLLSRVVEGGRNEVVGAALELAKVIASKSPIAVAGTKKLISHALDHSIADNLEYTAVWNGAALQSQDIAEIQGSATLNKAPQFAPIRRAKL